MPETSEATDAVIGRAAPIFSLPDCARKYSKPCFDPQLMAILWLRHLVSLSLFAILLSQSEAAAAQESKWRDAKDFEIEGKGWADTAAPYDRLPASAKGRVNDTAFRMSKSSAGICVRFVTNASTIETSWTLTSDALDMPHMPATGVSGLDLYARASDGNWRFIGNGRPNKQVNQAKFEIPETFASPRECLLYLPLYNGVKAVEIKAPGDSTLQAPPPRPTHKRQPLVVYGTSIAQGGCASRPGMVWTSILGRLLDRPVINLGFSGSGDMQSPVGEVLAELDPAVYIIDCIWNMGDLSQEDESRRVSGLVQAIRKQHPLTPIVFVGQSNFRPEAHPTKFSLKQEAAVLALQNQGVKGLETVAGNDLIGDDGEATVDGVHLTDIGMERQARALAPVIEKLLADPVGQ
ncbi:SGNH/GDSL hydrolase family protein [soil metagenome]